MKTIKVTDSNNVEHCFNPRFIVDFYKVRPLDKGDWCVSIIFSETSGLHPSIFTKVYKTEGECNNLIDDINMAVQSI